MNLPSYSVRYLIKILSYAKGGMEITKEEASKGIGFLSPRKASPKAKAFKRARSARKAAKSEKHRLSTKEIRAACVERAAGWCECGCGRTLSAWGETMDHFLCGSGQRRQRQSVETCWMLTLKCHAARQANLPSVATWNDRFRRHCNSYGYPVVEHVVHAKVPAPQAPESLPERIAK